MIENLVSILVPCYNSEKYLDRCLNSLYNQTYEKIEIILINDGSTDGTENIVKKFQKIDSDKKLIYIYQDNQGVGMAINNGLKKMNGEFFMWLDSDDYYNCNSVELCVEFLNSHQNFEFVRGKSILRNGKTNEIVGKTKSKFPNETNIFDFFVYEKDSYQFSGVFMIRTEYFDSVVEDRNIYPSRGGQCWQLILPVAYRGKCGYLDEYILNYNIYETSHSNSVKKLKDQLNRCNDHKKILFETISKINMEEMKKNKYHIRIRWKYLKKKIRIIIFKSLSFVKNKLIKKK